jgi:hypothetical protein
MERWHYIANDMLWRHVENDGISFLKRPLANDVALCSVEEAKIKYPRELEEALINESPPAIA